MPPLLPLSFGLFLLLILVLEQTNAFHLSTPSTPSQISILHQPTTTTIKRSLQFQTTSRLYSSLPPPKTPFKKGQAPPRLPPRQKAANPNMLTIDGKIIEALPNAAFKVDISMSCAIKDPILAMVSGKIRKNFVRIVVGDIVTVELSPVDLTKGRITFRKKG